MRINLLIITVAFSLESNAVDDSLPWDATLTLGSVSTTYNESFEPIARKLIIYYFVA